MDSDNIFRSDKTVLTLDAGGTNFIFSALRDGNELLKPIHRTAVTGNLGKCMHTLKEGFEEVISMLDEVPVAISFAFPGPADYKHGIIGDLPNFPCFRGGVPLGGFLEDNFKIPVYINNDGNLFAYGEALYGALPYVNKRLREAGNSKVYKNLLGVTFGTGFGGGAVIDNHLLLGDNGCGGDVWVFRNKKYPHLICEESVSIRAIKRVYTEYSQDDASSLSPKDIFDIAEGTREGNKDAALKSFEEFGEVAANTIAQALTIIDGLVVIGGGITGAAKYFMPSFMREMNTSIALFSGEEFPRLQMKAYNLSDNKEFNSFIQNSTIQLESPYHSSTTSYEIERKTGILFSHLGTSRAISLGAYAFALNRMNQ